MATRSDELTTEIRTTRERMDDTLDDLGRRAGPGRLTERMRDAVSNTAHTVMGAGGDTRDRVADVTGDAAESVRRSSQGNPLAAGLVAFGAGLLAGSLAPESRTEHRVAREVQRRAQGPLRDELQHSAGEVADRVKERATEAKEHVTEEGRRAKEEVGSDVRHRADEVREHASGAADEVREDVADQARHHSGQ